MSLKTAITVLRGETNAKLSEAHDHYTHSIYVWRLIPRLVKEGRTFNVHNKVTGNSVTETQLSQLVQGYVTDFLSGSTLQQFVTIFERFVFGFIEAWLMTNPQSLSKKELRFNTVLQASDKRDIVKAIVQKEVNSIGYKRVDEWFDYIKNLVNLGCPDTLQIEKLAEIKASRDVLVHNHGIVNDVYVRKSAGLSRFKVGEKLTLVEPYHRQSWLLIKQVVSDMSAAAIAKSPAIP